MSDGVIITLLLCVTVIAVAVLNAVIKVKTAQPKPVETVQHWPGVEARFTHLPPAPEETPTRQYVDEQVEPDDERPAAPALPIDPKNPPRRMTFPETQGNIPSCECHRRKLKAGQDVYAWPVEGGYRFTCVEEGR